MSTNGDETGEVHPQRIVEEFWENLITKKPGKVTQIFPPSLYANLLHPLRKPTAHQGRNAAESYQVAADECRARVKRIVRECQRTNEKFTDPDFDIEGDRRAMNCLHGLKRWYRKDDSNENSGDTCSTCSSEDEEYNPGSIHRIDWIFEKPAFTVDGFDSSDVQQGANGDCWFLAAVAAICTNPSLMHKVCVERNEECGVYGFVFYRDGEWTWTVVDDNLYLRERDWDDLGDEWDPSGIKERKWRRNEQTGSDSLYFASCKDQNETWLPLLEKAYAKIHGDYDAIAGGYSGEGVEDLTGGVTTKLVTNRILSKERLWKELLEVNKQFLFQASSPANNGDDTHVRKGLALQHAYSLLKAVEEEDEDGKKHRLVLIRNPWGKRNWKGIGEWNGPWSDGAKEWTPYWMNKLNYRFGDDGMFWMSYDDLLTRFDILDRTRLFDKHWTVVQTWTSVSVAWVTGYLNTKFLVEIKKGGPTVFVLAQLDERYFVGLEGKYSFDLHFLLQEEGAAAGDHIVRARGAWWGNRSISAEVDLEPGKYEVLPKVVAWKNDRQPDVHDVVRKLADANPQKLRQIGMNYDIAHSKGIVQLSDEEKKKREQKEKEEKEKAEKEKAEFEKWKKEKEEKEAKEKAEKEAKEKAEKEEKERFEREERAEFEAWKKAKKEKQEGKAEDKETTNKEESGEAKKDDEGDKAKEEKAQEAKKEDEEDEEDEEDDEKEAAEDKKRAEEAKDEKQDTKETKSTKTKDTKASKKKGKAPTTGVEPKPEEEDSDSDSNEPDDEPESKPDEPADDSKKEPAKEPEKKDPPKQKPWNAVCVLGLRVYSKDPEVSIKLVYPKDPGETAVLNAEGDVQAGATM